MYDYNKLLILLSVIQLSGGHCLLKLVFSLSQVSVHVDLLLKHDSICILHSLATLLTLYKKDDFKKLARLPLQHFNQLSIRMI